MSYRFPGLLFCNVKMSSTGLIRSGSFIHISLSSVSARSELFCYFKKYLNRTVFETILYTNKYLLGRQFSIFEALVWFYGDLSDIYYVPVHIPCQDHPIAASIATRTN